MNHFVIEDQVGQEGHAFYKPILSGLDPPVVLYMPLAGTQDYLLHFRLFISFSKRNRELGAYLGGILSQRNK